MRNQKRKLSGVILVALFGLLIISCNNKAEEPFDYDAQFQKEIKLIDDYLTANALNVVKDPLGIRMVITKLGTGLPAQATSTVDVDYKGTLFATGATFDQGNTRRPLTEYIDGWSIAFQQLPEGSEAILYIPSARAYRDVEKPGIPPHSSLVFEVKLKDVAHASSYHQRLGTDTVAIDNYLDTKGIDAIKDSTGIRYVITTPGSGAIPSWYDKLKLTYSIKLMSDDTRTLITLDREPIEYFYSRSVDYIKGMLIGLHKMPEGTKAILYIPSSLGFGPNGINQSDIYIPPNANLIVEVELKDIL
jgi:FKBP-type peptidyl-prolyl cis-trans isomerase FkpA